jgi:hypothetical protein
MGGADESASKFPEITLSGNRPHPYRVRLLHIKIEHGGQSERRGQGGKEK